jgi:hypothetical protein
LQLVDDPDLRLTMSNAGSDFVLRKFGYKRLVKDMSELYSELLAKNQIRNR